MTERRGPDSNVRDARLPELGLDALVAAVGALPERNPVRRIETIAAFGRDGGSVLGVRWETRRHG